jgi:hypothetical protein
MKIETRLRMVQGTAAFGLMCAALLYLFFGNTAVAQRWRLSRAQREKEAVEQRLAQDPRFQQVKVGVATMEGGATMMIYGFVASEVDLMDLRTTISSTHPATHVDYRVRVR